MWLSSNNKRQVPSLNVSLTLAKLGEDEDCESCRFHGQRSARTGTYGRHLVSNATPNARAMLDDRHYQLQEWGIRAKSSRREASVLPAGNCPIQSVRWTSPIAKPELIPPACIQPGRCRCSLTYATACKHFATKVQRKSARQARLSLPG